MIIQHDGKTIDTEREIRHRLCHTPARYVGSMKHDRHIFEWGDNCWDVYSPERAVLKFENVPQKHEAWFVVWKEFGYESKEMAEHIQSRNNGSIIIKGKWES